MSLTNTPIVEIPDVPDPYLECVGQHCELPQNAVPSLATHIDKNEDVVITNIRATDVALGLQRVPAGFYAMVYHSGLAWRTENKRAVLNDDVVEWSGPIPIPSDLSLPVSLEVYASFEFQPMLGSGELLRKLTFTVEHLLEGNANGIPFSFLPKEGVISPCSSISVIVKRRTCEKVLGPYRTTTESECQNELEAATNQGHGALLHYRMCGEIRDLERSIEEFGRALSICPINHPCRAAVQSNLAMAKFFLNYVKDTEDSFEVSLGLYYKALAARPVDHQDRPSTLIQLAVVHLARFAESDDEAEEVRAKQLLHEAMQLSSADSHEHRAAAFVLQLSTMRRADRCQVHVQPSVEQDFSSCLPSESWDLSDQLLHRFEQLGDLEDLQQAIGILRELVRSTPVSDDGYRTGLANLGVALQNRFGYLGELSDIEDAVWMLNDAVDFTPYDHPDKPTYLNHLGNSLTDRFERLGDLSDLEKAISVLKDAVGLTPDGYPEKPGYLSNLGSAFLLRFERLDDLSDLDDAISKQKDAVSFIPDDHPDKAGHLNNLGNSFLTKFERFGDLSALDSAISIHRNAASLVPHGHPDKATFLSSLGNSLFNRFVRLGSLSDIENAVLIHKEAVDVTPRNHPHKPGHLSNFGNSLNARFERLGNIDDLQDVISTLKDAVGLTPHGHPQKPGRLESLGNSFKSRFRRLGELDDLEASTLMLRDVVNLTPHGHPEGSDRLHNFGNSLLIRFACLGESNDLEEAIIRHKDAIDLVSKSNPRMPIYLSSLSNSLYTRYKRLGHSSDLENAISMLRDAVDLLPCDHPQRPALLCNLGNSFFSRFELHGEFNDLELAILSQTNSIELTPHGHPDRPIYLNNLGNSFLTRYGHGGEPSDLENAISRHRDAVILTPHSHPGKPSYLNSLGNALRDRFKQKRELHDLEEAISMLRKAVGLTPRSHPSRPAHLGNLGNCILTRYEYLGQSNDLEEAILILMAAVDLIPRDHPQRPRYLNCLGNAFNTRSKHLRRPGDLEYAICLYARAASAPVGAVSIRFVASLQWIACARRVSHPSLLHAYSVAISLLLRCAWIGLPLAHRYMALAQGADVVREAAAAALDSGLPETAVEWLEQGRSIVWGEFFQLRTSYEELSSTHPAHAHRLRNLSAALEHAITTNASFFLSELTQSAAHHHDVTEPWKRETDRHHALVIERDELLQEIRKLPGFGNFLLPKEFSRLRASAHAGPVVILNATESRCDALIVLADVDHVMHVPLPDFSCKRSIHLQNIMKSFIRHAHNKCSDDREGKRAPWDGFSWEAILSPLWKCVVKPVLDALAFSVPGEPSRIFWCPTGPFMFLPIHAAGFYDVQYLQQPGHKVFDFVVSSYVPTLSILPRSLRNLNPSAGHGNIRLLAVRQPPSDGLPRLSGVVTELEHIKELIKNSASPCTTLFESSVGTVEEVLALMKETDWVHFACHGIQDSTDSGLCLADGRRMKLHDIIALSRPYGGLAFLSACQTATGHKQLPDEAIHIAAGMLFAGYGGVVGTMWPISDRLAPDVARDVYRQLFQSGARPDYREAAGALHEAIGRLRGRNVSFEEWLPFIHVGF